MDRDYRDLFLRREDRPDQAPGPHSTPAELHDGHDVDDAIGDIIRGHLPPEAARHLQELINARQRYQVVWTVEAIARHFPALGPASRVIAEHGFDGGPESVRCGVCGRN